jgi:hypothetical protein
VPGKFYVNDALKSLVWEEIEQQNNTKGVGGFLPAVRTLIFFCFISFILFYFILLFYFLRYNKLQMLLHFQELLNILLECLIFIVGKENLLFVAFILIVGLLFCLIYE